MTKKELAIALHDKGYNCCQSVVCAFKDELGVDEETLFTVLSVAEQLGFDGFSQKRSHVDEDFYTPNQVRTRVYTAT